MHSRPFDVRQSAHKAAARLRADPTERLVLACSKCPTTRPSRRRPPPWGVVARVIAARLGAPAGEVRDALADALAAERTRLAAS